MSASPLPQANATSPAPDSTAPVVTAAPFDDVRHTQQERDSDPEDPPLRLTPGWIAVGVAAIGLGLVMGFIMSSVWLVR